MFITDFVSMIVSGPASGSSTQGLNPIGTVELASITIGMNIFLVLTVFVSYNSYKRRKETEARIAEWRKGEQERKRRLKEAMSDLSEKEQRA
ncbi:MAG: hypothetical protein ACREAW_04410 [Nitrososphaera sp.]